MSSSLRVVLGCLVAVLILLGAAGAFSWWKMAHLKEQLVTALGQAIGANVQVSSLNVDLWKGELHAAGITLTNIEPAAPWDHGDISQATVTFHLADIFSASLPLAVEVSTWNVVLRTPATAADESSPSPDLPASTPPGAAPGRIRVTHLTARGGSVEVDLPDNRKVLVQDVAFDATDNGGGVWTTHVDAGSVACDTFKAAAGSVDLRSDTDEVTLSNLHLACDPGVITGDGQAALAGRHAMTLNLKGVDLPMTMLVTTQWQMKLSGLVGGELHYTGDDSGGSAQGHVVVSHGKFNALPWLGQISSILGFQDISNVEVDEAVSDIAWKAGALELSNLDIRKTDVIRVAGKVDIDPSGQVDGQLRLGLPVTLTAKWPQMRDQVFPVQWEDYSWADVHLTGTADHLQEDLTGRLATAAVGQGSSLLQQAAQQATLKAAQFFNTTPSK